MCIRDSITPSRFLEFGDAVVHPLSYQQARHLHVPVQGVFVADPGYVFAASAIPRSAVITEVDGVPTPDLDTFAEVLAGLADRERAAVRYYTFDEPQSSRLRVIRMDRRWFPAAACARDDSTGVWPCESLPPPPAAATLAPASTRFLDYRDERLNRLARSLVMVNFDMPYPVSGVSDRHYHGTGLVIDAERGLVVVDRNTVPVAMGDVRITIAGSLELPGQVVWIHPLHNLAVVAYDPELVGETQVESAKFSDERVRSGDELLAVGLKGDHRLVAQSSEVASIDAVQFPLSRTLRFRDTNLETISLVNAPSDFDGVLVDDEGRVLSLWSSFAYHAGQDLKQVNKGVPADIVVDLLDHVRDDTPVHSLEVELLGIPLASARSLGLDEEWAALLETDDPDRRQAMQVLRVVAGTPAAEVLRPGDLVLSVDGEVVNSFREAERLSQKPVVEVIVWRDGEALTFDLATVALNGHSVERIFLWAGALLQEPHRAMAAQRGIEPTGVYVAYFSYGSPATRYGLWAGRRIVEVDGTPTPDLDAFIAAVSGRRDRAPVRLKTVTWNNGVEIITLKLDNRYWPAYELLRGESGWERQSVESPI